jgi:hypothetical protein
MGMTPEQKARVNIDALLQQARWNFCNFTGANIHAATCVAFREAEVDVKLRPTLGCTNQFFNGFLTGRHD